MANDITADVPSLLNPVTAPKRQVSAGINNGQMTSGVDSKGVRRSLGGNPQTGPFYVEGAFPGDTLVIRLNRVRLNRDSAISSGRIASTALTPAYVERTRYQADFDSNWVLDRANGVARLKNPSEHLKNYTVKLQPMVGCIATAPPAHQAFRTGYPGTFGGNMDYNQIREGTTVYLPVSVPGALLFLGVIRDCRKGWRTFV